MHQDCSIDVSYSHVKEIHWLLAISLNIFTTCSTFFAVLHGPITLWWLFAKSDVMMHEASPSTCLTYRKCLLHQASKSFFLNSNMHGMADIRKTYFDVLYTMHMLIAYGFHLGEANRSCPLPLAKMSDA